MLEEKRFDDLVQAVGKHEERINGLDREQAAKHVLLKNIKEDTEDIKKTLKTLPCEKHTTDLTNIKAITSFKKRVWQLSIGGGGLAGITFLVLRLTGII